MSDLPLTHGPVHTLAHAPGWRHSMALKCFLVAFIATHVPLFAVIGVVTLRPDWLTPWGVFGVTLVATLVATALVLAVLWRLFRPLRRAADGLMGFMAHGESFRLEAGSAQDEVARLVRILVLALAHLDRGRAALLKAGTAEIARARVSRGAAQPLAAQNVALVEVGDWDAVETAGNVRYMHDVQDTLLRLTMTSVPQDAIVMPWGRGRVLVILSADAALARKAIDSLPAHFYCSSRPARHAVHVVVEPCSGGPLGWTAALQRLEHRVFALRAGITEPQA